MMLRGPQTAGELRLNCERLQRFVDISSVEGFLNELAEWPAGPLVMELPRQPGSRENRWVHLLCGKPSAEVMAAASAKEDKAAGGELAMLRSDVARLEDEVATL